MRDQVAERVLTRIAGSLSLVGGRVARAPCLPLAGIVVPFAFLLWSPGGLAAQEPAVPVAADTLLVTPDSLPADTLLVVADSVVADTLLVDADSIAADTSIVSDAIPADTIPAGLRIGPGAVPFVWQTRIALPPDDPVWVSRRYRNAEDWVRAIEAELDEQIAARQDTLWMTSLTLDKLPDRADLAPVAAIDTTFVEPARPEIDTGIDIIPDALDQYADLDLQVNGQGQFNARWENSEPCFLSIGQKCNSGAVPIVAPEFQLAAIARGTISERIHLDVDWDQTREFDAANNLKVYYTGKPDEIITYAELGQVTLPLPRSQFISQGVPAGNFGVRSDAQFGPLRLNAVLAEQTGNIETRDITIDIGAGGETGILQDIQAIVDDVDYQTGQFFFAVDPRNIDGYPFIDVLNLTGSEVPDSLRPASPIKLYRHLVWTGGQQQTVGEGVIQADAFAVRPPNADPTLPDTSSFSGFYSPMVEGQDYIVHRSGLWVTIRNRVLRDEALASTYIAASGDTIGDYNAEALYRDFRDGIRTELPQLDLLKDAAEHRPGNVTWEREMHQIYRISGADDVERGSVRLVISQGPIESGPIIREFAGVNFSFLEIFGMDDQPRDDLLDDVRIWRPGAAGEFAGNSVVTGSYLVFPTLQPFLEPPPIKDRRVPEVGGLPFPLDDGDKNREIYEQPNDLTRRSAALYRLNIDFRARSAGRASSFSLGAIGIRSGSERVVLNGRELVYGQDYDIDYDIGQLTLLNPDALSAGADNPNLQVAFEQKALFSLQRKSILGLTGDVNLGPWGQVSFIGLSQKEGTIQTRPELGVEPSAIGLGGIIGDFDFDVPALTNFMNSLPGLSTDQPSFIQLDGEVASSNPTTNRLGATYVDDFESGSGQTVPLLTVTWRFGATPSRPDLSGGFLPPTLDLSNQMSSVWQSQWSDGQTVFGPLLVPQIDPQLRVLNLSSRENVLWVSLDDLPATGNGWASITHSLSQTGTDLTTSEFLEFYASTLGETSTNMALIIDIGTVSEDALVADSLGQPSGVGVLNQEVDPVVGVWGNDDDTGLWDRSCESTPNATAWPLGDERANCARNNGRDDSEDLNRDNFLNTDESFLRYVIPLNQASRYLNRDTGGEFDFSLYRIPLRDPDFIEGTTQAGGQQNVKHVRITLVSDIQSRVLLSRMNFTGSRWLKRGGTGSVSGPIGSVPGTAAQVSVGSISTVDADYVSPPGVIDIGADATGEISGGGQSINEQSLQLAFSDIPVGERIEAFRRYQERTRDFLQYREMRLWTLPVEGDWGDVSQLRFFLRVGTDEDNFFLYRTTLQEAPATPTRESWNPERLVDMNRWIALRTEAEQRILEAGGELPDGQVLVLWDVDVFPDGDSTYAILISNRSRSPNLSAIRELALGVTNVSDAPAGPGRLWIDEIRLTQAADNGGIATVGKLRIAATDVLNIEAGLSRRNPYFHQLGEAPDFLNHWEFDTRATLAFGRFLPSSLGLVMPMSFTYGKNNENPLFLPETDVLASGIENLRKGGNRNTRFNVGLSHGGRSRSAILRSTWDGMRLGYSVNSSARQATQTETGSSGWAWVLDWNRDVVDKSFSLLPGFLRGAIDALPGFVKNSTLMQNLHDLRFRWTPTNLGMGAGLSKQTTKVQRFETAVLTNDPAQIDPSIDLSHALRPNAHLGIQPFPSLNLTADFQQVRDLVPAEARVAGDAAQEAIDSQTSSIAGINLGWETARNIRSAISWQPVLSTWFDVRVALATAFTSGRSASYVQDVSGDTLLVRDMNMNRTARLDIDTDLSQFATVFGVPQSADATGGWVTFREFWDRFTPLRVSYAERVNAAYDRQDVSPTFDDYFVLGSVEDLRVTSGQVASASGDNDRWTIDAGYRLPANLEFDIRYDWVKDRTFSSLDTRVSRDVDWPNTNLRWNNVPLPGSWRNLFANLSLTAGYALRTRTTETQTTQNTKEEQQRTALSALLVFGNGFNINYRLEFVNSDRLDATGVSGSDRTTHDLRATGTVGAPGWLAFVRNPLRLALAYNVNGNLDCRALTTPGIGLPPPGNGTESCTPYVDQSTQNTSFTVDTDFTGYSMGIQFSWVRRSSGVGNRGVSNQYNFNLFGRFSLSAGR